jgi:hypothetical protein
MPAKLVAKTAVKSDDGKIYWIDTIEHEGGLWLVPKWLATTYPQMYKPARMIQMDTLAHNLVDYDFQRSGLKLYAIDDPIPKAVLDGAIQSSPGQRFVVLTELELLIRRET